MTDQSKSGATERQQNPIMKYFSYSHLPDRLQTISKPFFELASKIDTVLPQNAETSTALRKLLEAKDCAVRSIV
jgi:ferritin-like protein